MMASLTTANRILHFFCFLCKLGQLFFKPHWKFKIINKEKTKGILVVKSNQIKSNDDNVQICLPRELALIQGSQCKYLRLLMPT